MHLKLTRPQLLGLWSAMANLPVMSEMIITEVRQDGIIWAEVIAEQRESRWLLRVAPNGSYQTELMEGVGTAMETPDSNGNTDLTAEMKKAK